MFLNVSGLSQNNPQLFYERFGIHFDRNRSLPFCEIVYKLQTERVLVRGGYIDLSDGDNL